MKLIAAFCAVVIALGGTAILSAPEAMPKTENYILIIEQPQSAPQDAEEMIRVKTASAVLEMPEEEYLTCVVLSECLPSFAIETMKAQAVAARTFAAKTAQSGKHDDADVCADFACCQAYRSKAELSERFGSDFEAYWEKALSAVRATKGEKLYYNGALIDAVYYSCSGGRSEAAVAVWGSDVPYLQSVESPGEEDCSKFESVISMPIAAFREKLSQSGKAVKFSLFPQDWIGNTVRSEGGGIQTITLAGAEFTGTEVRKLFALPSTNARISVQGGEIVFDTLGYGHRVGMSQYGAEAMANAGSNYREILQHYYSGVEIR